ncbi:hypothetical protein [Marinitoga sp. 1138]|uniref:hypothetical protein n=1 Tax=Marinitoga sp. 1138 TaxID=1643334 RepID=UPI0015868D7B|nr:hypothetical protein [Marinitoga sp. 1138]NUU96767.1 hypothetical protein [Marinitoga sp. 1138]
MNSKERIIFWFVVFITVVFNLLGLIYFLSSYGGTNDFLLFIIAKFKDNYDWILPSLTLISSLIIFMWSEFKEHKRNKKASKPQIHIKVSEKEGWFEKKIDLINLSNNAAFNVEVFIEKNFDYFDFFVNVSRKELNIIEDDFIESMLDYEEKYRYYFNFVSKEDSKTFVVSPFLTFYLLKAFLYDLITEDDLYYKINIKYNNEEYYEYEEKYKIFFKLDTIEIYNEEYYGQITDEALMINEKFDHEEIIENKDEVLKKISNKFPFLVSIYPKIYRIEKIK